MRIRRGLSCWLIAYLLLIQLFPVYNCDGRAHVICIDRDGLMTIEHTHQGETLLVCETHRHHEHAQNNTPNPQTGQFTPPTQQHDHQNGCFDIPLGYVDLFSKITPPSFQKLNDRFSIDGVLTHASTPVKTGTVSYSYPIKFFQPPFLKSLRPDVLLI